MTIQEIAKMAGVSVSAVSRYLNNGYVSEEKSERIQKIIEETGYTPLTHARILRTRKTKVIGVIVPKISSDSISRVVQGISIELDKQGYQMLLVNTENKVDKEIVYLNLLEHNPVDGIIFVATLMQKKHDKVLSKLEVPIVIVGQNYGNYTCIYHDDFHAAKEVTQRLINAGRKRLACIFVTEEDKAAGRNRLMGYKEALEEGGLAVNPTYIAQAEFTWESGYEQMKNLLERCPDIDGVFCATDTIAVGAVEYIKESEKSTPENISVVGIGFSKISQVITPKLTTARLHYKTSGQESASMLLDMINKEDVLSKKVMLSYEIIDGESV